MLVLFLKNYPHLQEDDIQAALHYAAEAVKQEHVYPLPVWQMPKFLADENVPVEAAEAARKSGHDLAWIKEWSPGADDRLDSHPNPIACRFALQSQFRREWQAGYPDAE
jgi:hypothetical protein